MEVYEYMFLPLNVILDEIAQQYNLQKLATNGKVYCEIRKGMYGLPQASILANKKTQTRPCTTQLSTLPPRAWVMETQ